MCIKQAISTIGVVYENFVDGTDQPQTAYNEIWEYSKLFSNNYKLHACWITEV